MEHREQVSYDWREAVSDREVSLLHAEAFDRPEEIEPWAERLERYSLGWVTARRGEDLVGFCNVVTDGGRHAFLLDTVVHPDHQGTGIGRALVYRAIEECRAAPVEWLHVDFEIELTPFYLTNGLFRQTTAGILKV